MKSRNNAIRDRLFSAGAFAAVVGAFSTMGCYKATFVEDPSAMKRDTTHEEWTDHFIFGLVGDEKYDTQKWCPNGAGAVRTGGNVGTTTLTIITLGIYAPRKVYVTCEDNRVASMQEKSQ